MAYYGFKYGGMCDGTHPAMPRIYSKAFLFGSINLLICIATVILEKIFISSYYGFSAFEFILFIISMLFPIILSNCCADYIVIRTMPVYKAVLAGLMLLGIARLLF